ncbi:hypothetical protein [Amycolatopsis sp. DSM 110486]|uniref:hypothetical protein n=1 Tax=Amycolatopsis sp. DSM 110486 TaxID=2865832 RepID=UPI001C6A3CEA|nr:hypothetical protein [Amycolatopsis sp. DSM 110486]QYN19985.1 hypothetical protein K1T34_46695 [Amycolatopsis sp. DSM 110486]
MGLSPRWLAVNQHDERTARTVLTRLRGSEDAADAELAVVRAGARDEAERAEPLRLRLLTGAGLPTLARIAPDEPNPTLVSSVGAY